jgi:hypothetical protein
MISRSRLFSAAILVIPLLVVGASADAGDPAGPPALPAHPSPPAPLPVGVPQYVGALLGGLDKTTARVTQFEAPIGKMVEFGTLRITVKDCRKNPPELEPESAAFMEINELYAGQPKPRNLFVGWMFASSPALSALEHPVYDVWVLDCTMANGSSGKDG